MFSSLLTAGADIIFQTGVFVMKVRSTWSESGYEGCVTENLKHTTFCRKTGQKVSSKQPIIQKTNFYKDTYFFFPTSMEISSIIFLSKLYAMWPNSVWGFSPSPLGSFLRQRSLSLYAFWWQACGLQSFYSLWCSGPSHSLLLRSL